ncbi:kinase-like domain-containing protein [Gigaspora rosea]|uniref:Kinase-like domain-containing protein n=1 Tax=Gigaspora rosea TaxID=44941 RepID=A0A397U205_9GLOM|nr:kinase-like domain-containing protein [Gigaspora rosea]
MNLLRKRNILSLNHIDENKIHEFVREVKLITKIHHHASIIRFYGITQDATNKTYYMVFQFANNGDLRSYLQNHFSELDWPTKIRMAKDISQGVKCLHDADIVHRYLVSAFIFSFLAIGNLQDLYVQQLKCYCKFSIK